MTAAQPRAKAKVGNDEPGGRGGSLPPSTRFQRLADPEECSSGLLEDLIVGQAQDGEAELPQPLVTESIAIGNRLVVATIGFDDEASFGAEEVDDERSERLLAAEFGAFEAPAAKQGPQGGFGGRSRAAQSAGSEGFGLAQPRHASLSTRGRRQLRTWRRNRPEGIDTRRMELTFRPS